MVQRFGGEGRVEVFILVVWFFKLSFLLELLEGKGCLENPSACRCIYF